MSSQNTSNYNLGFFKHLTPVRTSGVFFLILVLIGYGLIEKEIGIIKENETLEMTEILRVTEINIHQLLQNANTVAQLAATTIQEDGSVKNFENLAAKIVDNNSDIKAIQLVPNGVIKHMYPLKGNEDAIGINIFKLAYAKREAELAIEKGDMYFAGPINLVQGGKAVIGRLPVYREGKFWGFSAVLINLNTFLQSTGLQNFNSKIYYVNFSKINVNTNEKEFLLPKETKAIPNSQIEKQITEGDWIIEIGKKSNTNYSSLYLNIFIWSIFCTSSSIFLFFLLKKPAQLNTVISEKNKLLTKTEHRFQTIFDNAAISICVVDIHTRELMNVNPHFCKLLEGKPKDFIGKSALNFVYDEFETHENNIVKLRNNEIRKFKSTQKLVTINGKGKWVQMRMSALWDSDEKPNYYLAFIEDITKEKNFINKLQVSKARFKSLFDNSPISLAEANLSQIKISLKEANIDGADEATVRAYFGKHPEAIKPIASQIQLLNINKEFLRVRGTNNKKEFIQKYSEILEDVDAQTQLEHLVALATNEHKYETETQIRTINNIKKDVLMRWYVVPGHEDTYEKVFISTVDISELKQYYLQLRKTNNLLLERNKRLIDFSYIISHNLRSHTSNIQNIIYALEAADSDEEKDELFSMLMKVTNSLDETCFNLNKITNFNTNTNLETVNLHNSIDEIIVKFKKLIDKTETSIHNNVKSDVTVKINKLELKSILVNLVSNAIRYRHPERKPVITIDYSVQGQKSTFIVQDNGIGIDLDKYGDKIFRMYTTFGDTPESKGLGLFFVKYKVEAMGGRVVVESTPDVGTTFKLIFDEV